MNGKCYYCNKELTEKTIKRHSKNCPHMMKIINDEINNTKETRNQFIISMKNQYNSYEYCIYLSIDENLQLQHLDQFIRDVWVECCGHLSSFFIDKVKYDDNGNSLYEMNITLKDVLSVGTKFRYEYDFTNPTSIILEVVSKIEVSKIHSQIEILSRNNEKQYTCNNCNNKAKFRYNLLDYFLCKKCANKIDFCMLEELLGIYFNSPRDGMCNYIGNKNYELEYMPGNNNVYKLGKEKPLLYNYKFTISNNPIYKFNKPYTIPPKNSNKTTKETIKMFKNGIYSFELEELLDSYTKLQLEELAKNFGINTSSNFTKNTYIKNLKEIYSQSIENEIYKMDKDKYTKLKKYIKDNGILNYIEKNINIYRFFMSKGFIFPAIHDKKSVFIVPNIVQDVFNNINKSEVRKKIKSNTEIINLFRGMIKAYGILNYSDTIIILKRYVTDFDEKNIIELLKENQHYYFNEYYVIENNNINLFVNSNIDSYENILLKIDTKMEYSHISKERLLAMADPKYLQSSDSGKVFFREILHLFIISPNAAIDTMYALALNIQTIDINDLLEDIIENINIKLDKNARFKIIKIFNDFLKSIPLWNLKGLSIEEIKN